MRSLRGDCRGATLVEHAAILPVFLLVAISLMELAWQFALAAGLDHGTRRGARWASLGIQPAPPATGADRLAEIIVGSAGLPIDPALLQVTSLSYPNHASLNGTGTPGPGGPNDVIKYTITYDARLLTPFGRAIFPRGIMSYRSVVIAQNEPFPR